MRRHNSCAMCWQCWRAVDDPPGNWERRGSSWRAGATDMRKQINGLALLVQEQMELNPFEAALFVFCNRSRQLLKAVYWDRTGFCLWMKRLEKGRFRWPRTVAESASGDRRAGVANGADGNRFLECSRGVAVHGNFLSRPCTNIVFHATVRTCPARLQSPSNAICCRWRMVAWRRKTTKLTAHVDQLATRNSALDSELQGTDQEAGTVRRTTGLVQEQAVRAQHRTAQRCRTVADAAVR